MDVNETIEIRSLVSRGPQNHCKLAMASRLAAFSGNTSLIATFSSRWFITHFSEDTISMSLFAIHCG